jgi:hypothetical protein
VRAADEVEIVRQLVAAGIPDRPIIELTGIPRATVRDWRLGRHAILTRPGQPCSHDSQALPREQYAYLLGTYLGDGCISSQANGVFRLRVTCDSKYPEIIDAIRAAMDGVRGHGSAAVHARPYNCVDVSMYWKHWPCLFPQHGPGLKWKRRIELVHWQQAIVDEEHQAFLCGLIDSDGCRITANYREKNGVRRQYGRYVFSNRSDDIRQLFTDSLDALGIHWTRPSAREIAVARQRDVRELDRFVGFKE